MKFQVLHEDPVHYHIKHPDGRTLKLEKERLSPEAHQQIQMMKDGGTAAKPQPSPTPSPDDYQAHEAPGGISPEAAKSTQDSMRKAFHFAKGGDVMGHQTSHNPNPKLAQVPEKDRFPNNVMKYAHGKEVQGEDTPVTASRLESAYGPEEEAAQQAAGPAPSSAPVIHNHYYMSPNTSQPTPDPASPAASPATQVPTDAPTPDPSQQAAQVPPAAAPSPTPQSDLIQQAQGAVNQENQATAGLGKVQGQEAAQNAAAYDSQQQHLNDQTQRMEQLGQQYHASWDKIANNTNPEIDPNHYWSSKSTGGKIAAALGVLLSGVGMGISGHAELAGKAVQDAINRDIDAQKATFANKDNLLRQYTEMYHSATLGEDALRLQYGAQVENMIKRNAAQAGTQTAGLMAQMAIAKNRQNLVQNMANLAQGQATIDIANRKRQLMQGDMNPMAANAPSGSGVNYNKLNDLQMTGLMPQKDVDEATKEAASYENHVKQSQVINQAFEDAVKNNTAFNRTTHFGAEPASVGGLQSALMPYLKDAEGRINEQELQRTDKFIPTPLDSPSKIKDKRRYLNEFLAEKAATPTLDRYGIKQPGHQVPQGQAVSKSGRPIIQVNGKWVYK